MHRNSDHALNWVFLSFFAFKGVDTTTIKLPGEFESVFSKFFVLRCHSLIDSKQFYRDCEEHKAKTANSIDFCPILLKNSGASWIVQLWLNLIQRVPCLSCLTDCIFIYYLFCFLLTYSSVQPEVKWFIFSHYINSYGNNIQRSLLLGNKL